MLVNAGISDRAPKPMPSFARLPEFLPGPDAAALLDFALASRDRFEPARVQGHRLDPASRRAEVLRSLEPVGAMLESRFRAALPIIFEQTGTTPFEPYFELELAAHGDGAHFTVHRDIPVGPDRTPLGGDESGKQDRILSLVLYFFREPKSFSGGSLRLHRLGSEGEAGDFIDIEPAQNSMVAFPSWVSHEVRPVRCPSGKFDDYRFAVNCWLCRPLDG